MSNEFKLVPVEPTEEMLNSVTTTTNVLLRAEIVRMAKDDWASMLAAAPQPPALGGEPERPMVSFEDHKVGQAALLEHIESLKNQLHASVKESATLQGEIARQAAQFKDWQASHHSNYVAIAEERDQLKVQRDELEKNNRRYEWIRSQGTKWSELSPALFERVNDECNPPYMALKFGEELDSAIDACITRAALSKPAGSEQA